MKRHRFNIFPLVFGAILILVAAWSAFSGPGWLFDIPHWLVPAAMILIGAALISPLLTSRQSNGEHPEENGEVEQSPEADNPPPSPDALDSPERISL